MTEGALSRLFQLSGHWDVEGLQYEVTLGVGRGRLGEEVEFLESMFWGSSKMGGPTITAGFYQKYPQSSEGN